ncbi:hypothetical protein GCM10010343_37020 [Streptomyces avidinii]|nr:hypothetical protein GCM10010343_37020 [Streptomyces avidinii]
MLDDVAEAGAVEPADVEGGGRTGEYGLAGDLGPLLSRPRHVRSSPRSLPARWSLRCAVNLVGRLERKPVDQYFFVAAGDWFAQLCDRLPDCFSATTWVDSVTDLWRR